MKNISILLCLFLFLAGCCCRTGNALKTVPQENKVGKVKAGSDQGMIHAEVIDMTGLDGCGFMLQLENGEKLEPVNLDNKYKINGMKMLMSYEPYSGASICMAGKLVTLTGIKELKND